MTVRTLFLCIIFSFMLSFISCDNEREQAIQFIMDNQEGHFTRSGTMVSSFLDKIYSLGGIPSDVDLQKAWLSVADSDLSIIIPDKKQITQDLLVKNIDYALSVWRQSPWKEEVSFELFCEYILPYRLKDEEVDMSWRKTLYDRYHHWISGVKDMKRAFEIVHDSIGKSFHPMGAIIPYTLSLIDLDKTRHGTCKQRGVYEAGVMRALGIPVAIDNLYEWANYSLSGHAWVALITKEGTYTVSRGDSVARRFNPIESSIFSLRMPLDEDHDDNIDDILKFRKSSAKVFRNTYKNCHHTYHDGNADAFTYGRFSNSFAIDVSADYFQTSDIIIESNEEYGYLCVFKTGADWQPVAYSMSNKGQMTFSNMGDSVVYMFGSFDNGSFVPKGSPFLFADGTMRYLQPDYKYRSNVRISRKYPITTQFVNYWIRVKDGYFAASNRRDFKDSVLLHYITYIPTFRNKIVLSTNRKFRYYRYGTHCGTKHNLAEIQLYYQGRLCEGEISSSNVKDAEKAFDGDTFSFFEGMKPFWITIDMGKPVNIDEIVFYSRNDDNYVIPDNDYELLYYDHGWQSLGIKHSTGYWLDYANVASNALYVLRNKTKGKEERIFTYENGKQIWW